MLVKIFPTTPKAHSNSFEIFSYDLISFSVKKSFNIQELFAPQVQTPWNQAHAHLLIKSFSKTPRTQSEASWFGGSHNHKNQNKTNNLPSFIDRCQR
jgi:hypothetical protein